MNSTILEKIISLRHELHRHPELSMRERRTAERIREFLQANTSLQVTMCDGWLYAFKPGKSDEGAIAFRADMDALPVEEGTERPYHSVNPGVSHKCGHDGHMAVLCALALELDRITPDRSVYLIFQPGEETGEGAKVCSFLLAEKHITQIYAFHNLSGYPEGTLVYRKGLTQPASEGLRIHLTGKPSHAAEPEKGKNPSSLIARIALYSEELCANVTDRTDRLLLSTIVGMKAGTGDFGVSAHEGEISLTLRAERESDLKDLENSLLSYMEKEAGKDQLTVTHTICDYFPETRNHEDCLENVINAASRAGVPAAEMSDLWRASEDFGYYLKTCPGAMFYIGNGEDYPAVHTSSYDFNDRIIPAAVSVFLQLI